MKQSFFFLVLCVLIGGLCLGTLFANEASSLAENGSSKNSTVLTRVKRDNSSAQPSAQPAPTTLKQQNVTKSGNFFESASLGTKIAMIAVPLIIILVLGVGIYCFCCMDPKHKHKSSHKKSSSRRKKSSRKRK